MVLKTCTYQISNSRSILEPLFPSPRSNVRIVSFVVKEETLVQKLSGSLSDRAMRRVNQLVDVFAILQRNNGRIKFRVRKHTLQKDSCHVIKTYKLFDHAKSSINHDFNKEIQRE